jgi:hypothetical protein
MKTTIDMARKVYGTNTEWTASQLDRLEQLVALVRADEREARAELDATNRQVEILSDALAESRREVAALKLALGCVGLINQRRSGHEHST